MPDKTDPPLVDLKVANPVTYLKNWWKKVIDNEGIDVRLRIRPLTSIAMTAMLVGVSFGLGRISLPPESPLIQYLPMLAPTPTPNPWRQTAFTGVLKYSDISLKYYLVTNTSEAITLIAPDNVNLKKLMGKRILATGNYNNDMNLLSVTDATDMELLPLSILPVPTMSPSPIPATPQPSL